MGGREDGSVRVWGGRGVWVWKVGREDGRGGRPGEGEGEGGREEGGVRGVKWREGGGD